MKKTVLFLLVLFNSCTIRPYYQLYKTEYDKTNTGKEFSFENNDLKVYYNLWGENGNGNFMIYNKTDSNIFIDLGLSHLIINSIANTYFKNMTISESSSCTQSVSANYNTFELNKTSIGNYNESTYIFDNYLNSNAKLRLNSNYFVHTNTISKEISRTKGSAVIFGQERILCIPPESGKIIIGFNIKNNLYRDCNLLRFPGRKGVDSLQFNKNTSPLIVNNVISYRFKEDVLEEIKTFKNEFWVKEIANYTENTFMTPGPKEFCDEKSFADVLYYIYLDPQNFYIKYFKGYNDYNFKH